MALTPSLRLLRPLRAELGFYPAKFKTAATVGLVLNLNSQMEVEAHRFTPRSSEKRNRKNLGVWEDERLSQTDCGALSHYGI